MRWSGFLGSGDDPADYLCGACPQQCPGQLIERSAGRQDVVHDRHALPGQIFLARECATDIATPFIPGQRRLRWGVTSSMANVRCQLEIQPARQSASDLQSLIEAALAQT
jgi:hypothetical protein